MKNYEEYNKWSTRRSWLFIILLSGSLLAWAIIMMTFVEDVPREWEFGNIEFTPAKSEYSTNNPDKKVEENVIEPLPDGVSMEEEKSDQPKINKEDE